MLSPVEDDVESETWFLVFGDLSSCVFVIILFFFYFVFESPFTFKQYNSMKQTKHDQTTPKRNTSTCSSLHGGTVLQWNFLQEALC